MKLALRIIGGSVACVAGAISIGLTLLVGHCGAFGGRCPSPGGLEGDVIGGLAIGAMLLVGGPILALRPDRRGLVLALCAGAAAALLLVLVAAPALMSG